MNLLDDLGVWGLAIAGLAPFVLVGALVFAVPVALKWRPSAFVWFIGPALLVWIGSVGTLASLQKVFAALAYVDYDDKSVIAAAGSSEALMSVAFGLIVAGLVLALSGALFGVTAVIGGGTDAPWRAGGAIGALAASVLGGVVAIGSGIAIAGPGIHALVGITAMIGGSGLALACLRLPEDPEEAERPAAGRPTAAAIAMVAVIAVGAGCAVWSHAQVAMVLAYTHSADRLHLAALAMSEPLASGVAILPALLGLGLGAAGPILAVGTLLPGIRSAIGGIGTMLVVFGGALGPLLALKMMAPLGPVVRREDLAAVVGAIALPDPKDQGVDPTAPCVLVASGGAWTVAPLAGPCAPLPTGEAMVAIAGDQPAIRLVDTVLTTEPTFGLLARPKGAAATGRDAGLALQVVQIAPVTSAPGAWLVFDDPTGEKLYDPAGAVQALPGDPEGWRAMISRSREIDPSATFVLVPRADWTVQDLVARCALAAPPNVSDERVPCAVGAIAEPVAAPERLPASAAAAPSAVTDVIAQYRGPLKYCYEHSLKTNQDLGGRVEVRFTVRDGATSAVSLVRNTTGDRPLGECVVGKVKTFKFPTSVAGDFVYPFMFQSAR